MATKSILKSVHIKNKNMGKSLLRALEDAENKKDKKLENDRTFTELFPEDITKYFGGKN